MIKEVKKVEAVVVYNIDLRSWTGKVLKLNLIDLGVEFKKSKGALVIEANDENVKEIERLVYQGNFKYVVDTVIEYIEVEEAEEKEMEKYLLNLTDGRISKEGNGFGFEYVTVVGEEKAVEGGFLFEGTKENGEVVEAFLSEGDYFNGKEFVAGTKSPRTLIEEGKALEEEARTMGTVEAIETINTYLEEVEAIVNKVLDNELRYELRDIQNPLKWYVANLEEMVEEEEAEEVVNVDTTLGKRLKAVQDLQLKRGDQVRIKFQDGEEVSVKVVRLGYMVRQTVNNKMIDRFYIEDGSSFAWDLYKAVEIQVLSRNPRSKKVLTEDMKQFNGAVKYYLAQDKAKEGYFQKKQEEKALAEATRKELAKGVKEAYIRLQKTNKDKVKAFAESEGLVLGCWDKVLDDFTEASLKHILGRIDVGASTDIIVRNNMKDYVVSVDFVEGEIDFTVWTKEEYVRLFGLGKFLDY